MDGPLPTKAKRKQDWLMEAFTISCRGAGGGVWPPSLPDSNSFRYFVWGESVVWVIAKSRNKTEDLIQKIKGVMGSFNRDTVAKVCKSLRSRI
jgi:hypothetical protein